ncbi:MAG: YbaB/EbfC family nucleoid-associated protein [Bryobacterales bacterium]|nr:YbaB/EbfC family nucleoid-associated protein [Bryobacterales bacterium]
MMLPGSQQNYMKEMASTQKRLNEEIDKIRIEASTGGGMVTVRMNGHRALLSVSISPEAAQDVEMLEDLVRGACNEAARRVDAEVQKRVGGLVSRFLLGFPGIGARPS